MANKKRKTLQIKRPDPKAPGSKKKTLPKVSDGEAGDQAATHPKTANVARPDAGKKTTRVELPDEDKIRQARQANASQDLEKEDSLPGAAQIEKAQNNATMPIELDVDSISSGSTTSLPDLDNKDDSDKTMQIDPEALDLAAETSAIELQKADSMDMSDQTMQIDPAEIEEASAGETMEVSGAVDASDQTMQIDPAALEATQDLEQQVAENDLQSMETMQMDPASIEEAANEIEDVAKQDSLEDSFNAQTMAMDPEALQRELAASTSKQEDVKDDAGATMDLSQSERPKTIMIKRPSSAPNAPTVKASRPAPGGRPVTAHQSQPKEGTSRVDIPADAAADDKEGKTIKLRRPSGAPSGSPSKVATVAKQAGLELNADGTVTAKAAKEKALGGGWLAVAIITFLISCGALWVVIAPSQPELPMVGRLVDVNNQLILR